jgi:hypothetical protein
MLIVFIDWLCCFVLDNIVPKPFGEDFQNQAFEESQLFFADQQGKLPWTCCTYEHSLYSVELELHDRNVYCVHLY